VTLTRLLPLASLLAVLTASAQQPTLPLWPHGAPEPRTAKGPERDVVSPTDQLVAGRKLIHLTDVSEPTLTVYRPDPAKNSGAAVLVFPGGGYNILALDLEGSEVCTWLNSIHVTCIVVKYRVPYIGHYPERTEDLEDAQQAMRLTRVHASEWGIDPKRVGVLGFSAGAHLAVVLGNHSDAMPNFAAVKAHGGIGPGISARPDFALILYPGYLVHWPDKTTLAPEAKPNAQTPPTFLLQAEDDPVHEENALVYYQALKEAKVPAELHLFAAGGHGYGLRPTELSITHWPKLAEMWLNSIHVISTQ
jgi:acetyl esterase/lipase